MITSSELLIKHFTPICKSLNDLSICLITDYFGESIDDDENVKDLFYIYKFLIEHQMVNEKILHNCFLTNRLDELIIKKFEHLPNKTTYRYFQNKYKIGDTYIGTSNIDKLTIDNDNCSNCMSNGFITNQNWNLGDNFFGADCEFCCKKICKICGCYNEKNQNWNCYECNNSSLEKNIKNKLNVLLAKDKNDYGMRGNLNYNDVKKLLNKQKLKCYICDDILICHNWKPRCLYQFSIDRLDNSQPHNKNNCLISCYYCNCRFHPNFNYDKKTCEGGCHNEIRNIIITKKDISDEKKNLLLNI